MHDSSFLRMSEFVKKYLDDEKHLRILDVGSSMVLCNYTYKNLFIKSNWEYFGLDIQSGDNVDIVAKSIDYWGIEFESYDVVISGQCLEHVKDVKAWIKQIDNCLKKDGIVCIIAPWQWGEHRCPVDCWRIFPDGMEFLLKDVCGFEVLEIFMKENDCVGIARKKA
jgi:SAM-dependent methyltransferase